MMVMQNCIVSERAGNPITTVEHKKSRDYGAQINAKTYTGTLQRLASNCQRVVPIYKPSKKRLQ